MMMRSEVVLVDDFFEERCSLFVDFIRMTSESMQNSGDIQVGRIIMTEGRTALQEK
jgi:hypothetical protein